MPTNRAQRVVFSLLMAFAMVYGMELYNQALMAGGLATELFWTPFADIVPLMAAVIVLESLVCGRIAHRLTFRLLDPAKSPAPPYEGGRLRGAWMDGWMNGDGSVSSAVGWMGTGPFHLRAPCGRASGPARPYMKVAASAGQRVSRCGFIGAAGFGDARRRCP